MLESNLNQNIISTHFMSDPKVVFQRQLKQRVLAQLVEVAQKVSPEFDLLLVRGNPTSDDIHIQIKHRGVDIPIVGLGGIKTPLSIKYHDIIQFRFVKAYIISKITMCGFVFPYGFLEKLISDEKEFEFNAKKQFLAQSTDAHSLHANTDVAQLNMQA